MIYLDNNATTAVAPEVAEAVARALRDFANPSSAYAAATESRRTVSEARDRVAGLLGASSADEVVFTSGGTESDNWAILGALESNPGKRHIVTTAVEHEAVRKLCAKLGSNGVEVTVVSVDGQGLIDREEFAAALRDDTAVVSVMMANNETGVIFPVEELAHTVKSRCAALFHVDGVNAAGKIAINLAESDVDLFSISAHKFHGPKGIGALYVKRGVELPSMFIGGGQEKSRRAGTEATHQIAGIGRAAELVSDLAPMEQVRKLRDRLEESILSLPETRLNGPTDRDMRLPNTANISFTGLNGEAILALLDDEGICVSTGSACNSADHSPSAVLQAMGVPYSDAMGAIRFSLGRHNTGSEIETVIGKMPVLIEKLRHISG